MRKENSRTTKKQKKQEQTRKSNDQIIHFVLSIHATSTHTRTHAARARGEVTEWRELKTKYMQYVCILTWKVTLFHANKREKSQ